jgi:post-segregation antitoxin (ccd killing protein)
MKTKLTVTVDADVLPRAKRYARSRGVSLSSLIDAALREMAEHAAPSFSERWRGSFEPAERDDARYRALSEKYL